MSLKSILEKYPPKREYLLEVLTDLDNTKENHYISEEELRVIAKHLDVSIGEVSGAMSFYTLLSQKPRGKYVVRVCNSVPCYLCDDFNVLKEMEHLLGVKVNETTMDGMFTLEQTACIGCCEKAPAISINHKVYGDLTPGKLKTILEKYRRDSK